ncbi:MAG: metallophosphoesterase, partial [Anaerolineae bacterium]|nr:metallophosphoesterase [Anaerolineae bacterium]
MTIPQVVEINSGITMVVTDLHGDWPLYARYRDVFLELRARGLAQTLVITGDFIHSNGAPGDDQSLAIVLDILDLKEILEDALVVLLGNHELPHIYHIPLAKGDQVFTPSFEQAIQGHREEVLDFFTALPFYVRTQAGVAICHAGAFPGIHTPGTLERLWNYSHRKVLDETTAKAPPARR